MSTLGRMLEAADEGTNPFVVFNREFRPEPTCFLPPACRAVALGEACFETFRLDKEGRIRAFKAHIQRLKRGADALGFDSGRHHPAFDFSLSNIAEDLLLLRQKWAELRRNDEPEEVFMEKDFRIRVQIGRADSSSIYDDDPQNADFFSLIRMFLAGPPNQKVRLWTSKTRRIPDQTLRGDVKWSFYVPNVQLIREARQRGAHDALMLDGNGNISEAATANVFFFLDGVLITPPEEADALTGITQAEVIKAAEAGGIPVVRRAVSPEEARTAGAGFITNSMRGISPIEAIDGQPLPVNHAGLRKVMKLFDAHTHANATALASLNS